MGVTRSLAVVLGGGAIAVAGLVACQAAGIEPGQIPLRPISEGFDPDSAMMRCMADAASWPTREELEPHAAMDPGDPHHLVAAWMTRVRGGSGAIQAARSRDGGRTWSAPATLAFNACAGGPPDARVTSDPWVTIDADGRAYVSAIGWTPGDDADSINTLLVAVSDDVDTPWAVEVVESTRLGTAMFDNTAITSGTAEAGHAVLTATRYAERSDGEELGPAAVFSTTDGGRTWRRRADVLAAGPDAPFALAPQPVMSRSGATLWTVFTHDPGGARLAMRASHDGGESWGRLQNVAAWDRPEGWPPHPSNGQALPVAPDIISAASGTGDGELWVSYASPAPDAASAVHVARTTDGGQSWEHLRVSAEGTAAWRPTLAVDARGRAVVTWFRPDPGADSIVARSPSVEEHAFPAALELRPVDASTGGLTAGASVTIDRFVWRPRRTGTFFLGDYHGLVASESHAVAVYARPVERGIRVFATRAPYGVASP